jgi:hypothetical protein
MNILTRSVVAAYMLGGLRRFKDHHPDQAATYPEVLVEPTIQYLARAAWCVLAGGNRMVHLDKVLLETHPNNAFRYIHEWNPILRGVCMRGPTWRSVTKRGVALLWPDLLKFEAIGARPSEPTFLCDWCVHLAGQSKKSA